VVGPQVQTCSGYGSHSPISLGHELLALKPAEDLDDHLLAVDVGALDSLRLELCGLFVLLFDPFNLLLLDVDRCDLHAKDDVLDLTLSETGDVDIILLCVVSKNEVLKFNLNLHPLLITEVRPNVMREGHSCLVWLQNDLCSLWVKVESPQDQDQPAEGREGLDRLEPVIVEVEKQHLRLGCLQDAVTKLLYL